MTKSLPEFSTGLTLAKRRVHYILAFCAAIYLFATRGWDEAGGFLLAASGFLFLLYEGMNYLTRRKLFKIWNEGQSVAAIVILKRDVPLASNEMLELAYHFAGKNYNSTCPVTDKQYYRLSPGTPVNIRIHPSFPTQWIIEDDSR